MPGRVGASIVQSANALALLAVAVVVGCYAKSIPSAPASPNVARSEQPAARPVLLAGVRAGVHGDNVDLIVPETLVHEFAERLYAAAIFSDVVYPLTPRSPAVADIVFELSVTSSYDLHRISNLARDIAVGLSVLLLQPVIPTVYDLEVTLEARVTASAGARNTVLRGRGRSRFESTWFRLPQESVRRWHRETALRAIDELVARIADRRGARPRPGTPES